MISYLENTRSYETVDSDNIAFEGGRTLGRFHLLVDDLDPGLLREPLPGFHYLPGYCDCYLQARKRYRKAITMDLDFCFTEADLRLEDGNVLEEALRNGIVDKRVIHGDPKISNMLFDEKSGSGVAMIDLDTVSAGLLQYDLGDCLRSFCNSSGEGAEERENVAFNCGLCRQVLAGYLSSGVILEREERYLLYQGAVPEMQELSPQVYSPA